MTLKKIATRLTAVLACLVAVNFVFQPFDSISANEESQAEVVSQVSEAPLTEANEEIIADDVIVQTGEIENIFEYKDGLKYDTSVLSVQFKGSEPAFDPGTSGNYEVTYTVTPVSGNPAFEVSRKIKVESKEAPATSSEGSSEESEDPLPAEVSEKETSEEVEISEEQETEQEELEEAVAAYAARAKKTYTITRDNHVIYKEHDMSDVTETTGPETYRYVITFSSGEVYYTYCSYPSRYGPITSTDNPNRDNGSFEEYTTDTALSRILYYGADPSDPMSSPAGSQSFFAQPGNTGYTKEQRFIITHMALGKADNDPKPYKNANTFATTAADALYEYATSKSRPAMTTVQPELVSTGNFSHLVDNQLFVLQGYKFTGNPEQSITFKLPTDVDFEEVKSTVKSTVNKKTREVTVYGGTSFNLKGNHSTKAGVSETIKATGNFTAYKCKRFISSSGYQNLALIYSEHYEKPYTLTFKADWPYHGKVALLKVDENKNPLAGAKLRLLDASGKEIANWESTTKPQVFTTEQLTPGATYLLVEDAAPDGYVTTTQFTSFIMPAASNTAQDPKVVELINSKNQINISKLSTHDQKDLAGAELSLFKVTENADGTEEETLIKSWTSDGKVFQLRGLIPGKYILRETKAPEGYLKANDVPCYVLPVTDENDNEIIQSYVMRDDITSFEVHKVDTDGNLLSGAELAIVKKGTDEVAETILGEKLEWTTDGTVKTIKGLAFGEYELVEVSAPDGYVKAEPIAFTVGQNTQNQKIVMEDEPTRVTVQKLIANTDFGIDGAELSIRDEKGKVVNGIDGKPLKFTSSADGVEITHLPYGTYYLYEDKAPEGFATADPVEFTLSEKDHDIVVEMEDAPLTAVFSKKDITNSEEVEGAVLTILDKNKEVVLDKDGNKLRWTHTGTTKMIQMLPQGDYFLREEIAPDGYLKATDVPFTMTDKVEVHDVEMVDDVTRVVVQKVDAKTGESLAGAELSIRTEDGELVKDREGKDMIFASSEDGVEITHLPFGTYILREETAPAGYATAEDVTFTLSEEDSQIEVTMEDAPLLASFSKKDITSQEELPGAVLTILDENKEIVLDKDGEELRWTSTNEPKQIEYLPVGKYFLREETAPDGYLKAVDVEFEIMDQHEIHMVKMIDDVTRVFVEKRTGDDNELLAGAILSIRDKDGNIVKDKDGKKLVFESDHQAVEITHLPFGEYVLHEDAAPSGYASAKDMEFTLSEEDFSITVTMVDDPITAYFSKKDAATLEELPGAELSILDEKGQMVTINGEELTWTSGSEPKEITHLPVGKYILRETKAPDGYIVAEDMPFEITNTSRVQEFELLNAFTVVDIEKVDDYNEPLAGAKLRLESEDGELIAEFTSTEEAEHFERLPIGNYVLREIEAPEGYALASPLYFSVEETSDVQTITLVNELIPDMGVDFDFGEDKDKNNMTERVDDSTVSTSNSSSKPASAHSAGTAADSGWMLWLAAAAVALVVMIVLMFKLRKSN